MTFREFGLLQDEYWRAKQDQERPMALLLWQYLNVHCPETQRDGYPWEDVCEWLGYAYPEPEPEAESLEERMGRFVEFWNAMPEGPRPG